jgi:hypothetical protein
VDISNLGYFHNPAFKLEPLEFPESSVPGYVPDQSRLKSGNSKPSNCGERPFCNYCEVSDSRFLLCQHSERQFTGKMYYVCLMVA